MAISRRTALCDHPTHNGRAPLAHGMENGHVQTLRPCPSQERRDDRHRARGPRVAAARDRS